MIIIHEVQLDKWQVAPEQSSPTQARGPTNRKSPPPSLLPIFINLPSPSLLHRDAGKSRGGELRGGGALPSPTFPSPFHRSASVTDFHRWLHNSGVGSCHAWSDHMLPPLLPAPLRGAVLSFNEECSGVILAPGHLFNNFLSDWVTK